MSQDEKNKDKNNELTVVKEKEGISFLQAENVSKNEVVDFIINKEVRTREDAILHIKEQRKKLAEGLKPLNEDLDKELNNAIGKHIKAEYGKTIASMEKNLDTPAVYLIGNKNWDGKNFNETTGRDNRISSLFILEREEAMIYFFTDKNVDTTKDSHMIRSAYSNPYEFMGLKSFLRINTKEVTTDKAKKISAEIVSLENELKRMDESVKGFEDEIRLIKSKKDQVKDSIIEQALQSSDEGKKLLDTLKGIDFGLSPTIALEGPKEDGKKKAKATKK